MAKNKQQKKEAIDNLSQVVKDSKSIVFVNFNNLQIVDETKLRRALRENDSSYKVVKKTLLKKAFEGSNIDGELESLPGMIAIAYGSDLLVPAREVYGFQKNYKDSIKIVGGVFDGRLVGMEEMMSIATIPSLQGLQGQFVNVINSPIQGLVIALKAIADSKSA